MNVMLKRIGAFFNFQQAGILLVILGIFIILTLKAGTHVDHMTGKEVNNFLNAATLVQIATDTTFFAIMAVGITTVIVSGGIDLSVGSIYALSGVLMALHFKDAQTAPPLVALAMCCGIGLLCGLLNGIMVAKLGVHPFVITLGTMWVYRGVANVVSGAMSIGTKDSLIAFIKNNLFLREDLYPVPMLFMIVVGILGHLYLTRTTWGRRIFAVGGNEQAARYAGLKIGSIFTGVYVITGLTAGLAAFIGCTFYGSASSADGTGYELYVIASAVVGGASLSGGKGSAIGAVLGALLIVLIRQSIRTLQLNQSYEYIIIGVAIVVAVVLDRLSQQAAQRRVLRARA